MQASPVDLATAATLLGMLVAAALYAAFLHSLKRAYESRWTWLVAMGGIALVGAVVGGRFTLPIPDLAGRELLWWAWATVFYHFCASAVPIVAWQLWLDSQNREEVNGHAAE